MARTYPRTIERTPIKVACDPNGAYAPSRMRDFSPAGLCWETDQAVRLQSPAFILAPSYQPGSFGLNAYRSYVAVVKWCRPAENASVPLRVGAQIISRSHGRFEDLLQACDLCGTLYPQERLERQPAGFTVCRACVAHLDGLSEDVLACLQRFAAGPLPAGADEDFR